MFTTLIFKKYFAGTIIPINFRPKSTKKGAIPKPMEQPLEKK